MKADDLRGGNGPWRTTTKPHRDQASTQESNGANEEPHIYSEGSRAIGNSGYHYESISDREVEYNCKRAD
jgi:hypothetical protein